MKERFMSLIVCSVIFLILAFLFFVPIRDGLNDLLGKRNVYRVFYQEELELFIGATDFSNRGHGVTTVFSRNRDTLYYSNASNSTRDRVLCFCRIDSTLVCVVSEKAAYQSVDCPIVTYDEEIYFEWRGKRVWLLDLPFVLVSYNFDNHDYWVSNYDPQTDDWYDEIAHLAFNDRFTEKMMRDHPNSKYYEWVAGDSSYFAHPGEVFWKGKWTPRDSLPDSMLVRPQSKSRAISKDKKHISIF